MARQMSRIISFSNSCVLIQGLQFLVERGYRHLAFAARTTGQLICVLSLAFFEPFAVVALLPSN
jgi:hypothetical protein